MEFEKKKYRVLVACLENWDTLMELPYVLTKVGCTVDVYCSKKSWLLKNSYYANWIECGNGIEDYKHQLIELSKSTHPYYDWIVLGDEALLKFLSEHKSINTDTICRRILPLTKPENKIILGSKKGLAELCVKYSLKAPKYLIYNHEKDFDPIKIDLKYPLILKQDLSWGGGGMVCCKNIAELRAALKTLNTEYPYIFQEFIKGVDIGVEAFYINGKLITYNAGEVTGYFKSHFGFTTKRLYFINDQLKAILENLGEAIGFNGFASIQVIYQEEEMAYYLLEADLRPNFYIAYGRFTGQNFSEAIRKKIDPEYIIKPNKLLKQGEEMEVAIFYRDIIRCFKQKDIVGLLKWVVNYKGYWRFIPLYDLKLFRNILNELFINKLFRKLSQ